MTPVLLRGLASPDTALQQTALAALLALSTHAPEAQQGMVERSLLETVLGMAFYNGKAVRQQALQLLGALAANGSCVRLLCEPALFKTTLSITKIQAEHADHAATAQALRIVHVLLQADGLKAEQTQAALEAATLLSACEDEAVRAAAKQAVRLCHDRGATHPVLHGLPQDWQAALSPAAAAAVRAVHTVHRMSSGGAPSPGPGK